MAYERYPRDTADDQVGEEYRRSPDGDRDRQYGARDYGSGDRGQQFGQRNRDEWRGDNGNSQSDQRGYYSAGSPGDVGNRGARYGGRYGDDFGVSQSGYGHGSYDTGRLSYARGDGRQDNRGGNYEHGDNGRPDMYRGQRGQTGNHQAGNNQADYDRDDRGFLSRAGDEVRSWFGDDEAERRREMDQRYDQRSGGGDARDDHYRSWRAGQIASLDRDYDEYRQENQQKFHSEFDTWRTDRQGQRSSLSRVEEHMDVVGSDGEHIGTVDKVRGDRVLLTKSDPDAGGHHHSIPSRWIQSVDDKVTVRKTAAEAKAAWRNEERGNGQSGVNKRGEDQRGAFFSEDDTDKDGHILNRSFSGTYR